MQYLQPKQNLSRLKTTGIIPVDSTKFPNHEFTVEYLAGYNLYHQF